MLATGLDEKDSGSFFIQTNRPGLNRIYNREQTLGAQELCFIPGWRKQVCTIVLSAGSGYGTESMGWDGGGKVMSSCKCLYLGESEARVNSLK